MLLDCGQCGAPLDVKPNAWIATCGYCHHTNNVRRSIQKRPDDWRQTPPGWQPPAQWTPPPQMPAQSVPLRYNPVVAARKTFGGVVAVFVLLMVGGTTLAVVLFTTMAPSSSSNAGSPVPVSRGASGWDGSTTLTCRGTTQLRGIEVTASASPAILLTPSCRLTIDNANIIAQKQLFAEEGGVGMTTLRNSRLTFSSGLRLRGNRSMLVSGSTLVIRAPSTSTVFEAAGNGNFTVVNSEITVTTAGGELTLASCAGNGCLKMTNGTLTLSGASSLVLFDTKGNGNGLLNGVTLNSNGMKPTLRGSRPPTVTNATLNGSPFTL